MGEVKDQPIKVKKMCLSSIYFIIYYYSYMQLVIIIMTIHYLVLLICVGIVLIGSPPITKSIVVLCRIARILLFYRTFL